MSDLTEEPTDRDLAIMQLRMSQMIYDALLTLLLHFDESSANKLVETHERFDTLGPLPYKEIN